MNLPNKLTLGRLILIPFFIVAFYLNFTGHYLVALGIFALAAFTDFLDGYIARKYNLVTDLGKFLDPIADKVLVLSALVFATIGHICAKKYSKPKLFGDRHLNRTRKCCRRSVTVS